MQGTFEQDLEVERESQLPGGKPCRVAWTTGAKGSIGRKRCLGQWNSETWPSKLVLDQEIITIARNANTKPINLLSTVIDRWIVYCFIKRLKNVATV